RRWGAIEIFFFSSRRRHTRFSRDWSSDVCSSDLAEPVRSQREAEGTRGSQLAGTRAPVAVRAWQRVTQVAGVSVGSVFAPPAPRSEERRVGREGSSRPGPARDAETRRAGAEHAAA